MQSTFLWACTRYLPFVPSSAPVTLLYPVDLCRVAPWYLCPLSSRWLQLVGNPIHLPQDLKENKTFILLFHFKVFSDWLFPSSEGHCCLQGRLLCWFYHFGSLPFPLMMPRRWGEERPHYCWSRFLHYLWCLLHISPTSSCSFCENKPYSRHPIMTALFVSLGPWWVQCLINPEVRRFVLRSYQWQTQQPKTPEWHVIITHTGIQI